MNCKNSSISSLDTTCTNVSRFSMTNETVLHKDRKSTRLNSSHANISYAVFCLKKKKILNYLYFTDSTILLITISYKPLILYLIYLHALIHPYSTLSVPTSLPTIFTILHISTSA